jgi:hypothetical protein
MELNGAEVIQTGPDTYYTPLYQGSNFIGIFEWHKCAGNPNSEDGYSAGGVYFTTAPESIPPEPRWTLEQAEPLTISPSILCGTCGHHGYIQDGQWVPA